MTLTDLLMWPFQDMRTALISLAFCAVFFARGFYAGYNVGKEKPDEAPTTS